MFTSSLIGAQLWATSKLSSTALALLTPLQICPVAPPGAQAQADKLSGYVLWGIGIIFIVGVVVAVASIAAGRVFHSPHASKAGIVGVLVILIAAILYVILPSIVSGIMGTGCIG